MCYIECPSVMKIVKHTIIGRSSCLTLTLATIDWTLPLVYCVSKGWHSMLVFLKQSMQYTLEGMKQMYNVQLQVHTAWRHSDNLTIMNYYSFNDLHMNVHTSDLQSMIRQYLAQYIVDVVDDFAIATNFMLKEISVVCNSESFQTIPPCFTVGMNRGPQ